MRLRRRQRQAVSQVTIDVQVTGDGFLEAVREAIALTRARTTLTTIDYPDLTRPENDVVFGPPKNGDGITNPNDLPQHEDYRKHTCECGVGWYGGPQCWNCGQTGQDAPLQLPARHKAP